MVADKAVLVVGGIIALRQTIHAKTPLLHLARLVEVLPLAAEYRLGIIIRIDGDVAPLTLQLARGIVVPKGFPAWRRIVWRIDSVVGGKRRVRHPPPVAIVVEGIDFPDLRCGNSAYWEEQDQQCNFSHGIHSIELK